MRIIGPPEPWHSCSMVRNRPNARGATETALSVSAMPCASWLGGPLENGIVGAAKRHCCRDAFPRKGRRSSEPLRP